MSLLSLPHPVLQEIMVENVLCVLILATKLEQRQWSCCEITAPFVVALNRFKGSILQTVTTRSRRACGKCQTCQCILCLQWVTKMGCKPGLGGSHLLPVSIPHPLCHLRTLYQNFFFFNFFFYCSGFCHTLKWNSHGFTCVPHPDPRSHLPLHPIPPGLPSAPGPGACLMHPTWATRTFKEQFGPTGKEIQY